MIFKRILLGFFLVVMTLPLVNSLVPVIFSAPLAGAVTYAPNIAFTPEDWWSGKYQESKEKYINDSFSFRADFIRLHNQTDYSLFDRLNTRDVIEGKNHYFYDRNYNSAYLGTDLQGNDALELVGARLQNLQEKLAKKGKTLIVAFAPNKSAVYPEYLPDEVRKQPHKTNNSDVLRAILQRRNVNQIDFNGLFLELRKTARYPPITPGNIHWTPYGALLCMDTMNRLLGRLFARQMPQISYTCNESDTYLKEEKDVSVTLNLITQFPEPEKVCHPDVQVRDSGCRKLNAVFVADSYYWTWNSMYLPQRLFNKYEFWYYASHIWGSDGLDKDMKDFDRKQSLERADVIVFLASQYHPTWYEPYLQPITSDAP